MLHRSPILVLLPALLLSACSLPIVSESELESESGQQFQEMRAQTPASTDAGITAYVNCVAADIVQQLEKPYSDEEWDVVVFESGEINAVAMPGGHIGVYTGLLAVSDNQDAPMTALRSGAGHQLLALTPGARGRRAA